MIALRFSSAALVQRLCARVTRIAVARAADRSQHRAKRAPTDWHSATALWPDFTGVHRDGE